MSSCSYLSQSWVKFAQAVNSEIRRRSALGSRLHVVRGADTEPGLLCLDRQLRAAAENVGFTVIP